MFTESKCTSSEQPEPNSLKTLDSLPRESVHLLPYREQLVVLQHTVIDTYGLDMTPLKPQDITDEDLELLHRVISIPDHFSIFQGYATGAIRLYEYPGFYVPEDTMQTVFVALERNLWEKYIGMDFTASGHEMGEIIHTLNLILEGIHDGDTAIQRQLSPGKTLASYDQALRKIDRSPLKHALFVGAMSPKSIEAIWGISRHMLAKADIHVIDIKGRLNARAAAHYRLPFGFMDGMHTTFSDKTHDVVFTNALTTSLDEYPTSDLYDKRAQFFGEMRRIIVPGGHLVMVEYPMPCFILSLATEENIVDDHDRVRRELKDAGFRNISVTPTTTLVQRDVDNFLRTGNLTHNQQASAIDSTCYLITAS